MTQYLVVLVEGLAETISRVEDDVLSAEIAKALHLISEVLHHRLEGGLHGHEDVRHLQLCYSLKHVAFLVYRGVDDACDASLGNVVDDVRSKLLHATARHARTIRVDGNDGVGLLSSHDGKGMLKARCLFFFAHFHSSSGTR